MADVLIAAIARSCGESDLEKILSQSVGMEASRLTLFVRDSSREDPARSRMQIAPFRSSRFASGTHGTNVQETGSTLALSAHLIDADADHLKGMGIPSEAAHHYNIAIDKGHSVVTYMASTETAALVEDHLRACGFAKIRRFAPVPPRQVS